MAEAELKNYDDFVIDTSSTKKRAIKVAFKARRTFVRKGTIIICLLFLILGSALIGIGASVQQSESAQLVKNQIAVAVIVLGVFVLLTGLIGGVGALMDHKMVVLVYQALLLIFFIMEVVVASLLISDSNNATSLVKAAWTSASPATISGIQLDFQCCGLYNTTDQYVIPPCNYADICTTKVVSDLQSKYWPAGFVGIILIIMQIIGIFFGCWMICGKKEAGANDLMSKKKRKQQQEIDATTVNPEEDKGKKEKKKKKGEPKPEIR